MKKEGPCQWLHSTIVYKYYYTVHLCRQAILKEHLYCDFLASSQTFLFNCLHTFNVWRPGPNFTHKALCLFLKALCTNPLIASSVKVPNWIKWNTKNIQNTGMMEQGSSLLIWQNLFFSTVNGILYAHTCILLIGSRLFLNMWDILQSKDYNPQKFENIWLESTCG